MTLFSILENYGWLTQLYTRNFLHVADTLCTNEILIWYFQLANNFCMYLSCHIILIKQDATSSFSVSNATSTGNKHLIFQGSICSVVCKAKSNGHFFASVLVTSKKPCSTAQCINVLLNLSSLSLNLSYLFSKFSSLSNRISRH